MWAALVAGAAAWLFVASPVDSAVRLRARARPAAGVAAPPSMGPGVRRLAGSGLGLGLVALGWDVLGLWTLPAAGVAAVVAYRLLARVQPGWVAQERAALTAELPGALDLIAACLRAGLPLRRAVEEVAAVTTGPAGRRLGLLAAQIRLGAGEPQAWRLLADDPVLGGLARDLARATATGVGLEELVAEQARVARESALARREVAARTVGVRSVLPLMGCYLPAFLLVGIVPIVAGFASRLFG